MVEAKPAAVKSDLRIAIVHDWLVGGGAERVVEQLHHMYPQAPIYTSYVTPEWRQRLGGVVRTGWLQHWPWSRLRKFVPFFRIWWFSRLDLRDYDVVISSSGAEAKGVKRLKHGAVHINYCHAPTHYYWSRYDEYLAKPGFGLFDPLARFGLKLLVGPLRRWDYRAAQRPNVIIANSNYTCDQIKKYYGRDAVVIHPPVDVDRFDALSAAPRHGFVVAGRQTPYKRIDLAVKACTMLNLPLKVIGNGPEHRRLQQLSGPSVTFLTGVKDSDMASYFATAEGFIFPGLDDFGITAVEALASGTPVIALKAGGALDYVKQDQTGQFFDRPTVESLVECLKQFKPQTYNHAEIAKFARQFGPGYFRASMAGAVKAAQEN